MRSAGKGRTTLTGLLGAAAAFGCLAVPASAGAAKIGPQDLTPGGGGGAYVCGAGEPTCTMTNIQLPNAVGRERAPFSGTITKWRVNIPPAHDIFDNDGPLALQVLKRTDNKPGFTNDEYAAVRESGYEGVGPGVVNGVGANLRIRKGQFIGLAHSENDTEVASADETGARGFQFEPALIPGEPGVDETYIRQNTTYLFNATVIR
jgi:hypothetical protein